MKRSILTASLLSLAVLMPGVASAKLSHSEAVSYGRAYAHVRHTLGVRVAGCKLIGPHATCHTVTDRKVKASTDVLRRMLAPTPSPTSVVSGTPQTTAQSPTATYSSSTGGYGDVPGVPSGFAACVATRESSNGAGSSNIYGIEGGGGSGSLGEQKAAFAQMYQSRGAQPWSPYDGC